MVKYIYKLIMICVFVLMINSLSANDLVINEVMSNEPGSDKDFEWIEIYNNTSGPRSPSFYFISIDSGAQLQPPYFQIPANQYGILCSDVAKYESIWGDGNGTWGDDTSQENYPVFEMLGIDLVNSDGIIYLIAPKPNNQYDTVSTFVWSEAGPDGVSWERILPDSSEVRNSVDPIGCTPGRINTVTPRDFDLGIASVEVWPDIYGETGFEIIVVNYGLQSVDETTLSIYYDNDRDSVVTDDDLIAFSYLPITNPGDTLELTASFELDGYIPYVLVRLPDDDCPNNDLYLIRVYGKEYPAVVISEFLADPTNSRDMEWVELKNRSDIDVDLNGWLLGDEKTFHPIVDSEYILNQGEYLVLCKDSVTLADYYNDNSIAIIQISSWASLNNDNDIVQLRDNYGNGVDSLAYAYTFGGNHTWARGEEMGETDRWGWSVDPGGTPGRMNKVYLEPTGSSIALTAEPNPFSPKRDGEMIIEFTLPPGDNITLKIYDLKGRIVRTLIDGMPPYDGSVVWQGKTDAGQKLKIGMYILYMEVSGVEQYKQTIVVAP